MDTHITINNYFLNLDYKISIIGVTQENGSLFKSDRSELNFIPKKTVPYQITDNIIDILVINNTSIEFTYSNPYNIQQDQITRIINIFEIKNDQKILKNNYKNVYRYVGTNTNFILDQLETNHVYYIEIYFINSGRTITNL